MSLALGTRRVLVTGASSGIGAATAEALLASGARVALLGRNKSALEQLAARWPQTAAVLACDLTKENERRGVVSRARQLLGGLDGLVQAAGVIHRQVFGAIDEAALREQLEINLVAPLRVGEEALQELEDGGAMVLLSSTLAERPIATSAVYSAAKAGLQAMGKVLAAQGAQRSLRVNSLCLGVVETPMVSQDASRLAAVEKLHPLGLGKSSDVASSVLWLLGAPWITGSEILLDGGLLLPQWNRP